MLRRNGKSCESGFFTLKGKHFKVILKFRGWLNPILAITIK
jgi:hypothetical protein